MKYILNAQKMKSVDAHTILQRKVPSLVLMERAALSIVELLKQEITPQERILAVCGTGNNGGDGIAVARILVAMGYQADILLVGSREKASKENKEQLEIAENFGVFIYDKTELSEYNVIVDALFGIGISKPILGNHYDIIKQMNQSQAKIYAVDIPSGIDTDTGHVQGIAVHADVTVTFGFCKQGQIFYPGKEYCGQLVVVDIGFPSQIAELVETDTFLYEEEDIGRLPMRRRNTNKGNFGRVLVIAGSKNMSGACYFAAKAAYTMGAGLVKVLTVEENRQILQTLLPEALLSTYCVAELEAGEQNVLQQIRQELEWATVVVVGPGLGIHSYGHTLLYLIAEQPKKPIVFDADAIHLLAEEERGRRTKAEENQVMLSGNYVLTPHVKEMSDLVGISVEEIKEQTLSVVRETMKKSQAVLVLKDAVTVVSQNGQCYVNTTGNSGMATGGSGDVLGGVIAGLLAQQMSIYEASCLGVYLHGLAGDAAAKKKSEYGLMASDLIEALPEVLNKR